MPAREFVVTLDLVNVRVSMTPSVREIEGDRVGERFSPTGSARGSPVINKHGIHHRLIFLLPSQPVQMWATIAFAAFAKLQPTSYELVPTSYFRADWKMTSSFRARLSSSHKARGSFLKGREEKKSSIAGDDVTSARIRRRGCSRKSDAGVYAERRIFGVWLC